MIQGTGSSVGKSIVTAALCRIFYQDGYRVAPFKSQNMSLNSYVTKNNEEIARAQVLQAEACAIEPTAAMNPILLKPSSDMICQVILRGKVFKNMTAQEYRNSRPEFKKIIREAYQDLRSKYDIVVIEGAGSPAEINLKDADDIVNMGVAKMTNSPVILVGDIDKGGVFASLYGTVMLLEEEERKFLKGIIINKFRGDIEILKPGIKMMEGLLNMPVLGVIPYMEIRLDEEDGLTEEFFIEQEGEIKVEVLTLRHISNFTDFLNLRRVNGISLRFVRMGEKLGKPDILIIPGSKNTIEDLRILRKYGYDRDILELREKGTYIIGICGGYQILGKKVMDPMGLESSVAEAEGLGLLDVQTVILPNKKVFLSEGYVVSDKGLLKGFGGMVVKGYEIHMGETQTNEQPFLLLTQRGKNGVEIYEGSVSKDGRILGTYIHGILDNDGFLEGIINNVRMEKGLDAIKIEERFFDFKERELNKLARTVRKSLDIEKIYEIIKNGVK